MKVVMIRPEKGLSKTEAIMMVERNPEMVAVQQEPTQERTVADQNICMNRKWKSERIKMALSAARRFFKAVGISEEH